MINKIYNKTPLLIIGFLAVCVLTTSLTYIFLSLGRSLTKPPSGIAAPFSPEDPIFTEIKDNKITFLLLAHGGPGHSGGELMDSIILVSLDTMTKKAVFVSVPRDTWIEGRKLNEGFIAGGYDLLKHQVKVVTGIFPQNYVSIDFERFKRVIDLLGGVDVNVKKVYEDKYYPIKGREIDTCGKSAEEFNELHKKYSGYQLEIQFECRYEHIKFEPGSVHMDGETALKYARSRHGDGDFGRSERQFVILEALKEKIISLEVLKKSGQIFEELVNSVKTNLTLNDFKSLSTLFTDPDSYKIETIHLTDQNVLKNGKSQTGQFILLPKQGLNKWDEVHEFIDNSTNLLEQ